MVLIQNLGKCDVTASLYEEELTDLNHPVQLRGSTTAEGKKDKDARRGQVEGRDVNVVVFDCKGKEDDGNCRFDFRIRGYSPSRGGPNDVEFVHFNPSDRFSNTRFWAMEQRFECGNARKSGCGSELVVPLGGRWDEVKVIVQNTGDHCDVTVKLLDGMVPMSSNEQGEATEKARVSVPKGQKLPVATNGVSAVVFTCDDAKERHIPECSFSFQIRAF